MPACFSCKKPLTLSDRIGRRETCPFCYADLHSCRNCTFYDPKAYNECREPSAERVVEKDKSNFCDFFQIADSASQASDPAQDAKKKLEGLFKKKS